jgi:hypothetical protein
VHDGRATRLEYRGNREQAARVQRKGQAIEVLMVTDWPKDSRTLQDGAEGRYTEVLEEPVKGSEKPTGQATLDGKVYEVYEDPCKPQLFLKAGTEPLPTIRLPRANITFHVTDVSKERRA